MYNTIPEFSFAVLLEALKLIIMMCGIFNFSIKKEKKWPFVSLGVAVCLISILVAVPLLLHVDPAIGVDNDIFQFTPLHWAAKKKFLYNNTELN